LLQGRNPQAKLRFDFRCSPAVRTYAAAPAHPADSSTRTPSIVDIRIEHFIVDVRIEHFANAPALRKSSGGIVSVASKARVDREKMKPSKALITS
jgi:hypothetical protein